MQQQLQRYLKPQDTDSKEGMKEREKQMQTDFTYKRKNITEAEEHHLWTTSVNSSRNKDE